ncbi:hypothetical protein GCM10025784_13590 [Citricoccus nitrophenolicus]
MSTIPVPETAARRRLPAFLARRQTEAFRDDLRASLRVQSEPRNLNADRPALPIHRLPKPGSIHHG